VGVLVLASPVPGASQICVGGLSFNFAPLQLGATAVTTSADHRAEFTAGFGTDRLFVSGRAGVTERDGLAGFNTAIAVGANQPLRVDNRLQFCPMIAVGRTSRGAADLTGHLAAGWLARNRGTLAIVPSIGVGVGTAVSLDGGVGFIIRTRFAITPRVVVRWDDGGPAAGAGVAFVMDAR
jgi:hypothetical protein